MSKVLKSSSDWRAVPLYRLYKLCCNPHEKKKRKQFQIPESPVLIHLLIPGRVWVVHYMHVR